MEFRQVQALKVSTGQSLAIFGAGTVGLSGLLAARAIGAGEVVAVEPSAHRRKLALGANHVIDPASCPDVCAAINALIGGVNAALDTSGLASVADNAL